MRKSIYILLLCLHTAIVYAQQDGGAIEVIETDKIFRTPKKTLPYDRDFILKISYNESIDVTGFSIYEVPRRFSDDLHERVYPNFQFTNRHKVVKSDDGKTWDVFLSIPPLRPSRDYEFMILSKQDGKIVTEQIDAFLEKQKKIDELVQKAIIEKQVDTIIKGKKFIQAIPKSTLQADATEKEENWSEQFTHFDTQKTDSSGNSIIAKVNNKNLNPINRGLYKAIESSYVQNNSVVQLIVDTVNSDDTKTPIGYQIAELYHPWREDSIKSFINPRNYIRRIDRKAYLQIEVGDDIRKSTVSGSAEKKFAMSSNGIDSAFAHASKDLKKLKANNDSLEIVNDCLHERLDRFIDSGCRGENISAAQKERFYSELIDKLDTFCKKGWSFSKCTDIEKCCKSGECKECEHLKPCTNGSFETYCGQHLEWMEIFKSVIEKDGYCDLRTTQDRLNKKDAKIRQVISDTIAVYILNTQYVNGSTQILDLATRNKFSISPDFGWVFYGMPRYNFKNGFNGLAGYLGVQFEFRYTDKSLPFWKMQRKTVWHFLSASVGFTLASSLAKDGRREELLANKTSLLTGLGIRLSNILRVTGGVIWFYRKDVNPVVDKKYLAVTPFIGLSLDISVKAFFNEYLQIGSLIKDFRKPSEFKPLPTSNSGSSTSNQ